MRDPVERIASNFYYMRSRSRWEAKDIELLPDKTWFNKTLDECVLSDDPECQVFNFNRVYIYSKNILLQDR